MIASHHYPFDWSLSLTLLGNLLGKMLGCRLVFAKVVKAEGSASVRMTEPIDMKKLYRGRVRIVTRMRRLMWLVPERCS